MSDNYEHHFTRAGGFALGFSVINIFFMHWDVAKTAVLAFMLVFCLSLGWEKWEDVKKFFRKK